MERGPKGGFEAGQPINTDDALNDEPKNAVDTFAQRMQARVEDGTYTQEEADALIEKANAKHAEKEQAAEDEAAYNAWASMTPDEATERSDAFANDFAGETNINSKTGKERTGSQFDRYARQAGESNEEFSARMKRMNELNNEFLANNPEAEEPAEKNALDKYKEMVEKRVEEGDMKREDADAAIARREEQFGAMQEEKAEVARNEKAQADFNEAQDKAKMEMAERIRKEVPEALEFLEKHPELKTEMTAAVKKLEELEEIAKINDGADKAIDAELAHRNETFMKAVEAFNAAARANEAARARMADFEKKGTGSDDEYNEILDEIHKSEGEMKSAEADKKNAESEYNAAEAAIRADQEQRTGELNARMEAREQEVADEREYYNEHFGQAQEEYQAAKAANEQARAKFDELEKSGKATDEELKTAEDDIHATEKAMQKAQADMEMYKQDQADAADKMEEWVDRRLGKEGAEDAPADGEKGGDVEPGLQALLDEYLNDPDFTAIYTKDGVFDEEACCGAITNMYNAKKQDEAKVAAMEADAESKRAKDVAEMTAEDGEDNPDDGFENEEQRGLFSKIRNFFNRSKRTKAGGERALKKQGGFHGWKKAVAVALYSLLVGTQLANFAPMKAQAPGLSELGSVGTIEAQAKEDEADEATKEDGVKLEDVADNLSLEVDLNAEKGEELSDLINTKYSDGTDLEINLSYGDYEGSAFFADGKDGVHNFTPWLYDHETEGLTDAQKAEQIQENLDQLADDPVLQGQMASLMGADLTIDGKSVTSFEGMREVQTLAQSDDVFRMNMADAVKDINRELSGHTLNLETVKAGDVYSSLYVMNVAEEGEQPRMLYFKDDEVTARKDFEVMQYLDEDGQNILDQNEIGGYKYNFLKAAGVIPEDATDEEAQDIMSKIRIIGISGKCGQLIWQHVNPDSGDESAGNESVGNESVGNESAGNESDGDESAGTESDGDESAGTESVGDESAGNESVGNESVGDESAGNESVGNESVGDESAGNESVGNESVGNESVGDESAGNESVGDESVGNESVGDENISVGDESVGNESVGDESVGDEGAYDGKTDILPGDPDDGWDQINNPTQEETGPTSEADRTPVDEGGNGYVNDETPGSSSNLADDEFLNGGDQGGGNTDADGGGSTNPETEATYDGSDTSGYDNGAQQETGTQTVEEPSTPEEVNQVNDSEANPESAGENQAPGEGAAEAMDRLG